MFVYISVSQVFLFSVICRSLPYWGSTIDASTEYLTMNAELRRMCVQ